MNKEGERNPDLDLLEKNSGQRGEFPERVERVVSREKDESVETAEGGEMEKTGNNNLLDKISELLALIQERRKYARKLLSTTGKETMNPWEYNEAILKRLNFLLERASRVKSREEAEELLKESNVFKKEIIAEGAVIRGSFNQIKDMQPEGIGDLLKNFDARRIRGGDLIKNPWDMENPDNYKFKNKFNVDHYRMILDNLEKTYREKFPKYEQVLKLNIAKDLQDENVIFYLLRNKKKLVGVRKIKKLEKKKYYSGTFYIDESLQNGFSIGQCFDSWTIKDVPKGTLFVASMATIEATIKRHLANGRVIVGSVFEEAEDEDGESLMSEELLKTHWQL